MKRMSILLLTLALCFSAFGCSSSSDNDTIRPNDTITAISVFDKSVCLGEKDIAKICRFTLTPYDRQADVANRIEYISLNENVARIAYAETDSGVSFAFKIIPVAKGETDVYLKVKNADICSAKIHIQVTDSQETATTYILEKSEESHQTSEATIVSSDAGNTAEKTYGDIVYITPTGKKYHLSQSCAGKNAIAVGYDSAVQTYEPCKKCAQSNN